MMPTKKKVFIASSGGGFAWETFELGNQLNETFDVEYIQTIGSERLSELWPNSKFHFIPIASHRRGLRIGTQVMHLFLATFQIYKLIGQTKPDLVIGMGSSASIPALIASKLRRIKSIYIESITRTSTLSHTCKLVLRFHLADEVFVQWRKQAILHKKLRYEGWVL